MPEPKPHPQPEKAQPSGKPEKAEKSAPAKPAKPAKAGATKEDSPKLGARKAKKPATPKITRPTGGNPRWLVPTMLSLFIVGILWVVTFYLTSGGLRLPIPAIGQWNIAAGFALILVGFGLSTRWK